MHGRQEEVRRRLTEIGRKGAVGGDFLDEFDERYDDAFSGLAQFFLLYADMLGEAMVQGIRQTVPVVFEVNNLACLSSDVLLLLKELGLKRGDHRGLVFNDNVLLIDLLAQVELGSLCMVSRVLCRLCAVACDLVDGALKELELLDKLCILADEVVELLGECADLVGGIESLCERDQRRVSEHAGRV